MSLDDVLIHLREKEVDRVFVFYLNQEGETRNVIYQDGVFFRLLNKKIKRFNPIVAYDELVEIQRGNYKILGVGKYGKKIKMTKIGGVA